MSASDTVIVASTLPVAVRCISVPEPGQNADYSIVIVGERDPNAINGTGITYGVNAAAFKDWIGLNPDLAEHVKIVTQAEVDAMHDTSQAYGHEAGLASVAGGAAGGSTVAGGANVAGAGGTSASGGTGATGATGSTSSKSSTTSTSKSS